MSFRKIQYFSILIAMSIILSACGNVQPNETQSQSGEISVPTPQSEATVQTEFMTEEATDSFTPTETETSSDELTWENGIKQIFEEQCFQCHGTTPTNGLLVSSYSRLMQGGLSGAIILPGNPEESHIFYKMKFGGSHPGIMTKEQLGLLREWISAGAPEN